MARNRRGKKHHVCLLKDGSYKIITDPKARDGVVIAYGPWYRDKCEWWMQVIAMCAKIKKPLDMSRHIDIEFVTNKPKEGDNAQKDNNV